MLQVEKELLRVQTAQEVVHLREKELAYYVEHIGSIQTVATLLAGFAFTAFLSMDSVDLDAASIIMKTPSGQMVGSVANGTLSLGMEEPRFEPWLVFSWFFHFMQAVTVCMCLARMLHVVMETLITRQLGTRLALRGPEGSIVKATQNMARSLTNSTKNFVYGLQSFMLSVVFHAIREMHPVTSVFIVVLLFWKWKEQWKLIDGLADKFMLSEAVSTAFSNTNNSRDDLMTSISPGGSPSGRSPRNSRNSRWGALRRTSQLAQSVNPAASSQQREQAMRGWNPLGVLSHFWDEVDDTTGHGNINEGDYKKPSVATNNLIEREEKRARCGEDNLKRKAAEQPSAIPSSVAGQLKNVLTFDLEDGLAGPSGATAAAARRQTAPPRAAGIRRNRSSGRLGSRRRAGSLDEGSGGSYRSRSRGNLLSDLWYGFWASPEPRASSREQPSAAASAADARDSWSDAATATPAASNRGAGSSAEP